MGSGDWLKNIISLKKVKNGKSKKLKGSSVTDQFSGFASLNNSQKLSMDLGDGVTNLNTGSLSVLDEDKAATRIQAAFRAFLARKAFRHSKGLVRLQKLTKGQYGLKQASTTMSHLHSWTKIQSQIRTRRIFMITEGGIRQKKLENQLKLEAKLHDLEAEWTGGSDTMDEVHARIQQREEAALKRERAMAYAFSHQWRANSNSQLVPNGSELANANWGWSWMERWIAARPWESRILIESSPNKGEKQAIRNVRNLKSPTTKKTKISKSSSPNGKGTMKARKLSYGATEIVTAQKGIMTSQEMNT